jgi:hypothetical protein
VADDATIFIVTLPAPDPDALDTALRECPFDNEMMTACLFAAEALPLFRKVIASQKYAHLKMDFFGRSHQSQTSLDQRECCEYSYDPSQIFL